MNRLFFIGFALITIFSSCKKTENKAPEKLSVSGISDTAVVDFSSTVAVTSNVAASYSLNKSAAGTVDAMGNYKAGDVPGTYLLTIKSNVNASDSIVKTIIVTQYATIFNSMRSNGGYLVSFRHAHAEAGADHFDSTIPEWWKSCDSTIARQLTPGIGPQQSDTTGMVLKLLKLPFDTIMTSVFCRAKQTAEHFNLSLPMKEYEELSQVYDEPNRYAKTMQLYTSKPLTNLNYLVVTHAGYSVKPTPAPLAGLNWGDCAIFKVNGAGIEPTYLVTIRIQDWLILGRR